jgi:hypothetical protein
MQPVMLVGELLSAVAARLDSGGDASIWQRSVLATARAAFSVGNTGPAGVDRWIITLTSLLALVAVGGVAARISRRLMRRSPPELMVLLNQSAAFYRRWPEHRGASAPSAQLVAEANRCQRIIELLEEQAPAAAEDSPAARGPIDGLHEWIRLLQSQIQLREGAPSGTAYA